jgi:VanZ family protein
MALNTDRLGFRSEPSMVKMALRIVALVSLIAICVLSLVPGEYRPHTIILPSVFEHVAVYTVAGLSVGLAYAGRLSSIRLILVLTAYGALLELCQLWIPGRHGQTIDIAADFAGASTGVYINRFGLGAPQPENNYYWAHRVMATEG